MSLFKDLISSIQPAEKDSVSPASTPKALAGLPKTNYPSPSSSRNAATTQSIKRKASDLENDAEAKIQRKDIASRPNSDTTRPVSAIISSKANAGGSSNAMPYRGTAGLTASKPASSPLRKITVSTNAGSANPNKSSTLAQKPPLPRSTSSTSVPTVSATGKKQGGYLAMLQKAKEKDKIKPITAPIKHEGPKIMSRKDRERARTEAKAVAKGKKPVLDPGKVADIKSDINQVKRKAPELAYQGTARPMKKPIESGYKGTARPNNPASLHKPSFHGVNANQRPNNDRYRGSASLSEDDLVSEEEENYASDGSSDMEGGMWDLENEEKQALKVAKEEDAKALAEENELKRQKEERKKKLMALNKAAIGKRKF